MKKYAIVSILETFEGISIKPECWPLHLTVLGNFYSDTSTEVLVENLKEVCSRTKTFLIEGQSKKMFGPQSSVSVTEVLESHELLTLHTQLFDIFEEGSNFEKREYNGEGYRPHVTDQVTGTFAVGEQMIVQTLSLVEFKESVWNVLETFNLK